MKEIIRVKNSDSRFLELVKLLDAELAIYDGEEHDFYHQFNSVENLKHIIICILNNKAVACGAMKKVSPSTMEIKRMYTRLEFRKQGLAGGILQELEKWALEDGNDKCVLETGKKQISAIALYKNNGYSITENYGQYIGVQNSLCFAKHLN